LMDWIRSHPADDHSVASMAQRAKMSERTLQRQFQDATGFAPIEWLTRERIALVKDMLETTAIPLAQMAEKAGFGSEESLRRHFRRLTSTTPAAYRRQFSEAIEPASP